MSEPPAPPITSSPRQALLDLIKRGGVLTVDEAVTALGASKTTVRSHLLILEEHGLIERAPVVTTRPGRPPLAFRLSPNGQRLFPTSDGEVLTSLLTFLDRAGHGPLLQAFFEQLWQARHAEFEAQLAQHTQQARSSDEGATDPAPLPARLAALTAVLERSHFMPEVRVEPPAGARPAPRMTVCERHCPFPAAVRATRLPCRLEARFLAHALGAEPTAVRYATADQPGCTFTF